MNNFETYLLTTKPKIQKEIKRVLSEWNDVVEKLTPSLKKTNESFINSSAGGKYIRGTLVFLGYDLFSNKQNASLVSLAAAFEILHTSLLIHDDIMDKSLSRRGKPALHTSFNNPHYGLSQAICFGDIGFFLAMQLVTQKNIASKISQTMLETILGQMLDLKLSFENTKKESEILTMQKLKTAYYSIVGPMTVGAMLANASKQKLAAIKKFGENLGLAYQIQDDILGVFGEEKITGKSTTNDIEENKNTLLIAYALKMATKKQKELLKKLYGKKLPNKKAFETIKNIFIETKALAYSQKRAADYTAEAKKIIPKITPSEKYQMYLEQFANFIIVRDK